MATITRGTTTLTPVVLLPVGLTRPGQAVAHAILNTDEVEITGRPAGPRAGEVRAIWATEAEASAAAEALAGGGTAWTFTGVGWAVTAYVVGDVTVEALTDWGGTWQVTAGVTEATS